ncbi:CubicO group peptidase, beta-lactamase class C family [Bradyrhizobium lablabi]|uniref:CubicO group peptidase, beta-lactamase class C family n=1 Tax=Bradyrhizobium lablabi TaxID=722472 RepID=A0A1M7BZX3_9BRAD|nr:serine hydrolase domain-containing protein [Bradyrhizobium lablabi]SHL60521.1 CubicO group peptidase, beta-lactamase class C family [Bradyrhizobium lablabi]
MEDMKVTASGYDFGAAHAAMRRYVDANVLSGVSTAVLVGRDLVDVNCVGWADKEAQTPLRVDHIFRVFSNTKLITSCATLLLFEEGRFQLDDPIERFIPQLANRRVLRPGASSLSDTEPAERPITIRHLLSHRAGLSYGFLDPEATISKAYNERKVLNPATTLAEMMDVLADLPLTYHPGTSWEYSVATDVTARLVEIISGQGFDKFIQSRILDPLGMVDTGFVVPEKSRGRLTAYYAGADLMDPMKPGLTRTDDAPYPGAYLRPFPRLNGGGGLVSTLPDMVALIRSLLPGGPTLLKPDTIALMMTNQLPEGIWMRFPGVGELRGRGFGLAGGLILEPSPFDHKNAAGELFWGGVAGTQWWISPKAGVAGLMMTQRQMAFTHPFAVEFKRLAYEAVKRKG